MSAVEVEKILIIQTAFLGDVVLATSLIEEVHKNFPKAKIHVLVRQGADSLLQFNPHIEKIWVWHKKNNKFKNLFLLLKEIRNEKYSVLLNLQRFFSSGLLTTFSQAKLTIGFKSNPWSFCFSRVVKHEIPMIRDGKNLHEVQRNFLLLQELQSTLGKNISLPLARSIKPKLYFGHDALSETTLDKRAYVVIAPASVWFTKQWPREQWIKFIQKLPADLSVFLVGGSEDYKLCQDILIQSARPMIVNTCGKLSLLQTALLMKNARRVLCNDSAPSHLASAVNAPQTVMFCSTTTDFGFGPLSDDSKVMSVDNLNCRPCGLHGRISCPQSHFRCALEIDIDVAVKSV